MVNFLEVGRFERTLLGLYVLQGRFDYVGRQNIARSRGEKRLKEKKS